MALIGGSGDVELELQRRQYCVRVLTGREITWMGAHALAELVACMIGGVLYAAEAAGSTFAYERRMRGLAGSSRRSASRIWSGNCH